MPRERLAVRVLGVAAILVAAIGLGMFLGTPDAAVAQDDSTTTTVVEDDSTATTVVEDDSTDSTAPDSTDESSNTDRPAPGDPDCDHGSDAGSSTESALSNA